MARKSAHGGLGRKEYVLTKQRLLKMIELWLSYRDVGRNSASAGHLSPTVGQLDFGRMLRNFALVIAIQRNRFVIALNEPSARRVVARDRKSTRLNSSHLV